LVGIWHGYWSPSKGNVETERYLFLSDGRWGWLATRKQVSCLEQGVSQKSGRWSLQGDQLALTELERQQITGCKEEKPPEGESQKKAASRIESCHQPEIKVTRNQPAVVETLSIGQCPPNQEAQEQDRSYTCLSIGGRAFWRQAGSENADQRAFLGEP